MATPASAAGVRALGGDRQIVGAASDEQDGGARFGEQACGLQADPAARPGDDADPAGEIARRAAHAMLPARTEIGTVGVSALCTGHFAAMRRSRSVCSSSRPSGSETTTS